MKRNLFTIGPIQVLCAAAALAGVSCSVEDSLADPDGLFGAWSDEPTVQQDPLSDSEADLPELPRLRDVGTRVMLHPTASCDELLAGYRQQVQAYVDQQNRYEREYLPQSGGLSMLQDATASAELGSDEASSGTEVPKAGEDYSDTNVQETGVDEADFVKTDGEFVYLLTGNHLLILAARPAEATREVGSVEIEGRPAEMYRQGDRVLVFSETQRSAEAGAAHAYRPPATKLTLLDVSDRSQPRVLRETWVDGSYSTSRRIESRVFVVTGVSFSLYDAIRTDRGKPEHYSVDESQLTVENLVPQIADLIQTDAGPMLRTGTAADCTDFLASPPEYGAGLASVYAYPMDDPTGEIGQAFIGGTPGIVYATRQNLYITRYLSPYWTCPIEDDDSPEEKTLIHQFDLITDPNRPAYVASGSVPGRLLDQFSLGGHRGLLRLATTEGHVSRSGNGTARNHVFVLQQQAHELAVVGEVKDIAPGEQIYSARFMGERGFVVTFKKVDPLFTVDLRDPAQPRLAGELKIPGYSTYLQLLDPDHVLAIGKDADDQGSFAWYQGVQLSLFDVSDFDAPRLQHKQIIGSRGTESEALREHKAFNYFAPKSVVAIPIVLYEGGKGGSNAGRFKFAGHQVYRLTLDEGFTLLGAVDHGDLVQLNTKDTYALRYAVQPRRTLVIGDDVYSISRAGLKVSALAQPSEPVAQVAFPLSANYGYTDW